MKKCFVTIMILTLLACESPPVRRQENIAMHPEWNVEMIKLIQSGYLAKGMDGNQVRAAWGRPCWSCAGTTKGDWGEAWEYATQLVFFDAKGKVTRWEKK